MTSDGYIGWFQRFCAWTAHLRSAETPVVLKLDGLSAHQCLEAVLLAKANHVELLVPPPHSSHLTQELDVAVFRPLKAAVKESVAVWLNKNPGKQIAAQQFVQLLADGAWEAAFTQENIKAGFRATGVFPFNAEALKGKGAAPPAPRCDTHKLSSLFLLAEAACNPVAVQKHTARRFIQPESVPVPQHDPERPLTRWLTADEEIERLKQQVTAKAAAATAKEAAAAEKAEKREAARREKEEDKTAEELARTLGDVEVAHFMLRLLDRTGPGTGVGRVARDPRVVEHRQRRAAAIERWKAKRGAAVSI